MRVMGNTHQPMRDVIVPYDARAFSPIALAVEAVERFTGLDLIRRRFIETVPIADMRMVRLRSPNIVEIDVYHVIDMHGHAWVEPGQSIEVVSGMADDWRDLPNDLRAIIADLASFIEENEARDILDWCGLPPQFTGRLRPYHVHHVNPNNDALRREMEAGDAHS